MTDLVRDWLLDPLALLFLLSLALGSLALARGGSARGLAAMLLWIACALVASAPVIVNPLVAAVEERHPASRACPAGGPVVVLGGGVDSRVSRDDEVERMRPATLARVAAGERLAREEPGVALVLSGGGLGGDTARVAEADVMASYLVARGMDAARLVREGLSGDTASNAREVARLFASADADGRLGAASGDPGDGGGGDGTGGPAPVRLVTSALHMPRALATFRAAGVDACPVAVDRLAIPDIPPWALMPQVTALVKFDALLHEVVALALYRLRGDL